MVHTRSSAKVKSICPSRSYPTIKLTRCNKPPDMPIDESKSNENPSIPDVVIRTTRKRTIVVADNTNAKESKPSKNTDEATNVNKSPKPDDFTELYPRPKLDYEESVRLRSGNNLLIAAIVRHSDKYCAAVNDSTQNQTSEVTFQSKKDPPLQNKIDKIATLQAETCKRKNEFYGAMKLTSRLTVGRVATLYPSFRAMMKYNCQSRLRRQTKKDYSVLNGSKRQKRIDEDISRSGSAMSVPSSVRATKLKNYSKSVNKRKICDPLNDASQSASSKSGSGSVKDKRMNKTKCRTPMKERSSPIKSSSDCCCGKCDLCLNDDADTVGCELSDRDIVDDASPEKDGVKIETVNESSPTEKRKRKYTHKMLAWKFCYHDESERKVIKRPKTSEDTSVIPTKRSKVEKDNDKKNKVTDKQVHDTKPTTSNQTEVDRVKDAKTDDVEIKQEPSEEIRAATKESEKSSYQKSKTQIQISSAGTTKTSASGKAGANTGSSTKKDNSGVDKHKDGEVDNNDPSDELIQILKSITFDMSKIEMTSNPFSLELTKISHDQFFKLVIALQPTEYIVKKATTENIKTPGNKNSEMSILYTCTVCKKDQVDSGDLTVDKCDSIKFKSHQQKSDVKNEAGGHRIESSKLPRIRPKLLNSAPVSIKPEPTISVPSADSNISKSQRRVRTKIAPKTQPHIVPRAPQIAPKPCPIVGAPQYEASVSRVPPIIFPKRVTPSTSTPATDKPSTSTANNDTGDKEPKKDSGSMCGGRVVVKATCFQARRPKLEPLDQGSDDSDNLHLDPDLKDRIISDIAQTNKTVPDSRGLREAFKRMGRRKTDPDIHPITRRMNKKVVRKMYTGNESVPTILKRPPPTGGMISSNFGPSGSSVRPAVSSMSSSSKTAGLSVMKSTLYNANDSYLNNRSSFRNFGSPLKVQLDNRGRYVDPYKPLERHEETPATALTASERLRLQKFDGTKPDGAQKVNGSSSNANNDDCVTSKSSRPSTSNNATHSESAARPGPSVLVRPKSPKKQGDSGEDSDFELGESQPFKTAVVSSVTSSTSNIISIPSVQSNAKIISPTCVTSNPVHIKILPKPESSTTRPVNLTARPIISDKSGFRKILPRPEYRNSSQSSSQANISPPCTMSLPSAKVSRPQDVSVVTVPTADSKNVHNSQRHSSDLEDQSAGSASRQSDREMLVLKSILRQKSPSGSAASESRRVEEDSDQGPISIPSVRLTPGNVLSFDNEDGIKRQNEPSSSSVLMSNSGSSLRVPPASSYTTITTANVQPLRTPAPMKPITIRMTRVKAKPTFSGDNHGVVINIQNKRE